MGVAGNGKLGGGEKGSNFRFDGKSVFRRQEVVSGVNGTPPDSYEAIDLIQPA